MKFIFVLAIFLLSSIAFAQKFHKLSGSKKCYVKLYEKGELIDINPKKFQSIKLVTKPHSKNKKFSLFKFKGEIYITPTSCLSVINKTEEKKIKPQETADEEDLSSLNKAAENRKIVRGAEYSEKRFFIHLAGGKPIISNQNSIFDYNLFDGINCDPNNPALTCNYSNPSNSPYYTGASISGEFGWASSNGNYWIFSLKTFKGSKTEKPQITLSNSSSLDLSFGFQDTITSYLFGKKFIFNNSSQIRPTVSLLGGLSTISSTMTNLSTKKNLDFQSSGFSLGIKSGLEFMLNSNIGLSLGIGYEFLGTRVFRIVEKNGETSESGFRTKQDYSHAYFETGLITYF